MKDWHLSAKASCVETESRKGTDFDKELWAEKSGISHNPFKGSMRLKLSKPNQKTSKPDEKSSLSEEKLSKPDDKPTKSAEQLSKSKKKLPKTVDEDPMAPYSYPVDIRLDSAAPYMWIRRLLGRVDGVRVYTGPLAKL